MGRVRYSIPWLPVLGGGARGPASRRRRRKRRPYGWPGRHQGVGVGLLYIVLWEGFFAGFVAGVRLLSIRYHALAAMHGLDARRFAESGHVGLATVAAVTALVFGGFLWLTIRHLRRMDVA